VPAAPAQQLPAPELVLTLLTDALVTGGIIGLDETAEAEMINKAFRIANRMIAQWQHERYMVYQLVDYGFVSTGAQFYTVGAGQNFNINPRPDRLEFAFLRQLSNNGSPAPTAGTQPFDWPLEVIDAYEDYAAIRLKTLGTFSTAVFYDPGFPIGKLHPWPVPQAGIYELHVLCKQTLAQFPSLQSPMLFPPEYGAALEFCLARRFCVAFQMTPPPDLNALAAQGKNIIRKANTMIPTLRMPAELVRSGDRAYDYRSDS
jgi:hypothetical protein